MIMVANRKNELIPTKIVTRWRICMDYRKLNLASKKDYFPLPFIDQMLDRLVGNKFFYFLDRYSRYNQIMISPEDQEKTTFTCPYGTFGFKRHAIWVMQRTRDILAMYNAYILRFPGIVSGSVYG